MKRVMSVFCDLLLSIFLGMKPFVVISDVNLAKEISVKHFDKFMNRFVSDYMCTCFLKYASIYKYRLYYSSRSILLHIIIYSHLVSCTQYIEECNTTYSFGVLFPVQEHIACIWLLAHRSGNKNISIHDQLHYKLLFSSCA